MPASIVTTLVLWTALLLPGASVGPKPTVEGHAALYRQGASAFSPEAATVRAWPLGQDDSWTISEADTDEEESDDGDGDRIASESRWSSLRHLGLDFISTIRPNRGVVRSVTRSLILRC